MLIHKSTLAIIVVAAFAAGIGAAKVLRPVPVQAAGANRVDAREFYAAKPISISGPCRTGSSRSGSLPSRRAFTARASSWL